MTQSTIFTNYYQQQGLLCSLKLPTDDCGKVWLDQISKAIVFHVHWIVQACHVPKYLRAIDSTQSQFLPLQSAFKISTGPSFSQYKINARPLPAKYPIAHRIICR